MGALKTYFRIVSAPVNISFECPFCKDDVSIPWRDANAPDYWGDQWDDVQCPECGNTVELGDWEYD